ncbi:MAG TPA: sialidase family protein [Thermoanaerobaculia bacterium]|nr:sialidase family protein [Thermoanaerobaculia bacterium]
MPKKHLAVLLLTVSVGTLIAANVSSEPGDSQSPRREEQESWGSQFWNRPVPKELLEAPTIPKARAAGPKPFRVSFDILQQTSGNAQPETQAEPHLALNPERENHLLAGYQEGRFADGGALTLTYAVSFNGGKSWREGFLPGLTKATGGRFDRASDPWVAFGPGNRAYYASLLYNVAGSSADGIYVSASDDGGLTWGDPVTVHLGGAAFDDKEALTVDTRSDSPYQGRVHVVWDSVGGGRQPLLFSYSADEGRSYRSAVTVFSQGGNIGAIPVVGPAGVVHLVWLNFLGRNGNMVTSRSTDGGDTWSPPVLISNVSVFGIPGSRTGDGLPSAAVDPRNGALYVVWQDDRFSRGIDQVVLSRSTDGGQTWSAPKLVSDGPRNAANFTPAVAVSPDGVVGVAYYSFRNDPSRRVLVDEYLAISRDGGKKFAKSVRVSSSSWDLRWASVARGFFLGDYQGLAAGKKMFYPLWVGALNPSRSEAGELQPDVFTRGIRK